MNFKLKAGAFAPIRAHKQDAGVDLLSPVTVTIYPGDSATIDTGVCAEIPEGFCGQIWSKSGLNVNHGILSTGMVDSGFSGSIKIKLYNHSHEIYTVNRGDKISQLVVTPCDTSDVVIVDEIASGERGENGFGSTGR